MRSVVSVTLSFALVSSLSLLPRPALAQGGPSREDTAKAEALFHTAKDADAKGDLVTACAGFAESQRLDPQVGTLLNLADCEARSGKPDDARAHYEEARGSMALADTRRQFATDQIALLGPRTATGGGASAGVQRDATSSAPPRDNGFSIAALLGYGTDDMSFGVGLRAGKVVFSHIYAGATFVYQFGQSTSTGVNTGYGTANVSTSVSAYYVGPEVGYEFEFRAGSANIVLRPYVGLGLDGYIVSESTSGTGLTGTAGNSGTSATQTGFVVWPGATGIYELPGSSFFLTADLRAITIPGGPAFGMYAGGGMRL